MTTRQEMELDATAHNKYLKSAVKTMSNFELLCNCHPSFRLNYVKRLRETGELTEAEVKSFTIPKKYSYDND